jgi:hypothetical protein
LTTKRGLLIATAGAMTLIVEKTMLTTSWSVPDFSS